MSDEPQHVIRSKLWFLEKGGIRTKEYEHTVYGKTPVHAESSVYTKQRHNNPDAAIVIVSYVRLVTYKERDEAIYGTRKQNQKEETINAERGPRNKDSPA